MVSSSVRRYVWLVAVLAAVSLVWQLRSVPSLAATAIRPSLLALALDTLAYPAYLELRVGSHSIRFIWAEVAFAVTAWTVPAPLVAAVMAAGVIAASTIRRTQPLKALFNCSATAVSATLAVATLPRPFAELPLTVALAERLAVAVLVYAVCATVLTWVVVARAQAIALRTIAGEAAVAHLVVIAGNLVVIVLGVGALVIWHGHLTPWVSGLLIAVVPALVHLGYWLHLFVTEEDRAWRRLNEATLRLNNFSADNVFAEAAADASRLFRADRVRIDLTLPGRPAEQFEYIRASTGVPVLSLERSLQGVDGPIGTMTLGFSAPIRLREHEERALDLFSHAVAATARTFAHVEDARAHAAFRESQALTDLVTGLATRHALVEHAQTALSAGESIAVIVIGIEHFGDVNTMLGPDAADELLCGVAKRLRAVGRSGDMLARLHGAEFAVVLHGLRTHHGVSAAAAQLISSLADPFTLSGIPIVVEAQAGFVHATDAAADASTLLRRARLALFDARTQERPTSAYEPALDATSDTGLQVIADLRQAIDNGELVLHYQPKFELRGGRPAGAEALVRWQHPQRGMVPPMDFIPAVERSPLIRDFTLHVLDAAVAECATWDALGAPLPIAVNLSPRSLLDPQLPEQVEDTLRRHRLPSHRLILEITETVAVSDLEIVTFNLTRLRGMGIQLSLDDFGTGFSSISLLTRQAVDELKIDREFVSKMTPGSRAAHLVENLIKLAHGFDLTVVAEGVENEEQQQMLRAFGCDHAQGFYMARPMPADQVRVVLAKASADAAVTPTGEPTGTIDGEHRDRTWKEHWTNNPPQP